MKQELKAAARSEYLNHIIVQESSTLSIVKYCKLNNIDSNKFYYYKSYRPAASVPKAKSLNKFTQVRIKPSENSLTSPSEKAEPLPVVKLDKVIDPIWLAKFLYTLNSCK